jgi:hypothetical protein
VLEAQRFFGVILARITSMVKLLKATVDQIQQRWEDSVRDMFCFKSLQLDQALTTVYRLSSVSESRDPRLRAVKCLRQQQGLGRFLEVWKSGRVSLGMRTRWMVA